MSLSKGIFVYKARNLSEELTDGEEDVRNGTSKDKHTLQGVSNQVTEIVNSVNHQVNKQLFDNLVHFCQSDILKSSNCIPAAAVITGVNIPDHHSFFKTLKEYLQNNVTPMIVLLQSSECRDIKQSVQNFVKQIMQIIDPEKHLSRDDLNIQFLQTCYDQHVKRNERRPSSPKKKRHSTASAKKKAIIVIFEDLESFSPSTVEDFILICSKYIYSLPIQFIFGVSTSVTTIQTFLPYKALAQVILHSFSSEPATVHLTHIIDEILMKEDFPFKLGHRVFQVLLDNFLYHDFSISNFVSGLKFSMVEHYYNNDLSYLCCTRERQKNIINHMKPEELDKFRRIVSFMNHVDSQRREEQKKLLLDDDYFKKILKNSLKNLQIHHRRLVIILHALMALVQDIPGYPLGKQMRESYSLCLQGNLTQSDGFKKAFKILGLSSRTDLLCRLSNFQAILAEKAASFSDNQLSEINGTLTQSINIINEIYRKERENMKSEDGGAKIELTRASNRYQLQEQLKGKKKQPTEFEAVRDKLLVQLEQFFKTSLTAPTKQVFHEICYFDDISSIKKHFIVSPRACLQRALNNPHHYLKCDCCKLSSDGQILSSMPDICIVYKLMQESSRLINLFDWLQAFHTVVNGDQSFSEKPDDVTQTRFIHAVSELQFIGYIKPTKKKTDHMAKLTWA